MTGQPAHDGGEAPLPDPTAPPEGTVVHVPSGLHVNGRTPEHQKGTVASTPYGGVVLVEMLVPVRKAIPVDRLRQIGDGQ